MLSQYDYPNRYRFLHLVRHGQYERTDDLPHGKLTELGRQQARDVAAHLLRRGIEPDVIWCSTMSRAEETARIICEESYPDHTPKRAHLLREKVFPGHDLYESIGEDFRAPPDLLDRIFGRWVRPSRSTRHEILVCHGNIIRAMAIRAVGAEPDLWHMPHLYHCSTTEIVSFDQDRHRLVHLNCYAYIPPERVTAY